MNNRKEIPVRNNPGIYKQIRFDGKGWKDTSKFRAIRRVVLDGRSRKEQAIFDNIEDAKSFRAGLLDKVGSAGRNVHKNEVEASSGMTFSALVEEWKSFHYLQLESGTQQYYDNRLPHFESLNGFSVEKITPSVIDRLVKFWVKEAPKSKMRSTFEKELTILKVILGYYQKRINQAFRLPILDEHYRAADVLKKAVRPVQSLTEEDLGRFLEVLKDGREPQFYFLALTQFCFGLRIGEACALRWSDLDLKNREVVIEQTIVWDHKTWEPKFKLRPKNGRVRVLSIPEVLVHELERHKKYSSAEVDLVFHRYGKPLVRKNIGHVYNRALKKLGITHVSGTHMIRKTSATLANAATGDFYAVSKLMDHSSPNITLRYVAQTSVQKQKIANALNGVLEGALGRNLWDENVDQDGGPVPQCPASDVRPKLKLVISRS